MQLEFYFTEFVGKFSYDFTTHKVGIPDLLNLQETHVPTITKRYKTLFHWIISSINHELLHKLLHEFVSFTAMRSFDTLDYGDLASGFVG